MPTRQLGLIKSDSLPRGAVRLIVKTGHSHTKIIVKSKKRSLMRVSILQGRATGQVANGEVSPTLLQG